MINLFLPMMVNQWSWILIFLILKHSSIEAYNLDVDNAKIFQASANFNYQRRSYFGFSLALYGDGEDSVLVVGAPRGNSSSIQSVIEPGTVHRCSVKNETCKEWVIDKSGNGWHRRYTSINQIKDHAWIGATIAMSNKVTPRIVVCAPRWKNNVSSGNKSNWFMNGICYWTVIKDSRSFETEAENEILPLSSRAQQINSTNGINVYNYGMGQAGFSMHVSANDLTWDVILGCPGIFNWKGSSVLITQTLYGKMRTAVPSVKDEKRVRTNDYFGYSVTSGHYKSGELWFASGAPRALHMHGNVIVFTASGSDRSKLEIQQLLVGEQYGEYFGASLASCDLNGDGKHELIVGAPHWTKVMDEGRIYVFTTLYNEIFERQSYDGVQPGGRFGSTVTCLGDIDYDGYGDIVVGAPYEGESGAIYIFNGNVKGLPTTYSQRIFGKQFRSNIRGFGISVSEPSDINGDKYLDIAVGAYLSDHAVLIKSKPVVTIKTKLIYNESKKILRNSTFFLINACTSYDGVNVPEKISIVKSLKTDHTYGRAFYVKEKSSDNSYKFTDTLYKDKPLCSQLEIQLKKNIQNIIDPIEVSLSVALEEDLKSKKDKKSTSYAVINKFLSKTADLIKLPFAVDCGEDNICVSDVEISLSTNLNDSNNRYIVGSSSTVKLTIDAMNRGEPAYQARICVYVPEIISLESLPTSCTEGFHVNNTLEVTCDIGNPFRNTKRLILDLDMRNVRFDVDSITLWTNFNTQSEEKTITDNAPSLTIHFDADIDMAIAGKAQNDLYSYFLEDEGRLPSTVQFEHIYEVQKFGSSPVDDVMLTISIPTHWIDSADEFRVADINQTLSYMDGQQLSCRDTNSLNRDAKKHKTHSELNVEMDFSVDTNVSLNLPPANRSMYINCTNPNVRCAYVTCELGPFWSTSTVAKVSIILDFYLFDFKARMMKEKDIIFFLTSGNVTILEPYNVTQKNGQKPDYAVVATMFLGSPIAEHIATWIVALSITLGILLLVLVTLILFKIGFFKRKTKEELEALKCQTNSNPGITLETYSSRETLDHGQE